MNSKVKQLILDNEYKLLANFEQYSQSIKFFIKKLETVRYDAMLYELIVRSFATKEKVEQENCYNMYGFKSSRQLINEFKDSLDFNDVPKIDSLHEGDLCSPLEICSMADNYNNQVGMYYLTGRNSVIIKSTVEDNDRPYDDKWIKEGVVLRYFMQNEKEANVQLLSFSHKPNSVIFNSLMEQEILDIYVFINKKKGEPYKYHGIFHPCGIVSKNKAFLLFKDGCDDQIPYNNMETLFIQSLAMANDYPMSDTVRSLVVSDGNDFFNYVPRKIKQSKKNALQLAKIQIELDLRGETLVMLYERTRLTKINRKDLADKVQNVTFVDMNLGYDIKSFDVDQDGKVVEKHIKVKTSVSHKNIGFDLTENEYEKIADKNSGVEFYRVYDVYTDCPKYVDLTGKISNFKRKSSSLSFSL